MNENIRYVDGIGYKSLSREERIIEVKTLRRHLDQCLQRIKALEPSVEKTYSEKKATESIMWLGMDLKRLSEPDPYPNSKDPSNTKIEPTADGLKL